MGGSAYLKAHSLLAGYGLSPLGFDLLNAQGVYIVAQLKFTNKVVYDRYKASFPDVFRKFRGPFLVADECPQVLFDRPQCLNILWSGRIPARLHHQERT